MNWNKYFTYDGETGELAWKPRDASMVSNPKTLSTWNTRFAGKVAGYRGLRKGNVPQAIMVSMREISLSKILAHHIVWQMHNGPIPEGLMIDHRNGNPFDNRLSNLRLATNAENSRNSCTPSNNTSGLKGVSWFGRTEKWKAEIRAMGRKKHLGYFATKEEAHAAYCDAAKQYHGDFARTT